MRQTHGDLPGMASRVARLVRWNRRGDPGLPAFIGVERQALGGKYVTAFAINCQI